MIFPVGFKNVLACEVRHGGKNQSIDAAIEGEAQDQNRGRFWVKGFDFSGEECKRRIANGQIEF